MNLSGDWWGSGPEPAARRFTVPRSCGHSVAHWRLYQDGTRIGAVRLDRVELGPGPRELPVAESAWGTVVGDTVSLESVVGAAATQTVHWRLTYDPTYHRLVGTRGDEKVWLAPLTVAEPEGCEDPLVAPAPFALEGTWRIGSGTLEPQPSVLVEQGDCIRSPASWLLVRRGDRYEAYAMPETFNQGIVKREALARPVPEATGELRGLELLLDGERTYRLRYDPLSGHLRGMRDGVAVWAVKLRRVVQGGCPGVP